MSKTTLDIKLKKLLEEVIFKHNSQLMPLLDSLGKKTLTIEQREEIREIIAAELCETGLDGNDEPNPRGLLLEEIIARLSKF